MPRIGYARVSAGDQNPALQVRALRAAGVRRVVVEQRSGVGPRPALEALLLGLRPGDVLCVYKVRALSSSSMVVRMCGVLVGRQRGVDGKPGVVNVVLTVVLFWSSTQR